MKRANSKPATTVRCAIYTRKSTEEGLEQEYNTLDAQRDSGENLIRSQAHEGWQIIPDRYDDGGFTGGNMDRPALKRLMKDIESGKVQCVVVYKVDRLSRSLLDFARMMEIFERHHVAFVSVTQHFNTSTSMGRLILNVLLSFAQFEREMISERTRDKIAAARRKGKWIGGMPVLGYDVVNGKLVVNEEEAQRVREIFELYLKTQSLSETARELNQRGWKTKEWGTKKELRKGGVPFCKNGVHQLLKNVAYVGKVGYRDEVHPGEHQAIIAEDVFLKVQSALKRNRRLTRIAKCNKHGALLKGLLRCGACDCAMTHTYAQKGKFRYRYYVCRKAQIQGWKSCPAPSVAAGDIEDFVVNQLRGIAASPEMLQAVMDQLRTQRAEKLKQLTEERQKLQRQLNLDGAKLRRETANPFGPEQVALLEVVTKLEQRLTEVDQDLASLSDAPESEVAEALTGFGKMWESLTPAEKARSVDLLVEQVVYNATAEKVSITFHQSGINNVSTENGEVMA
jgi:site-specific DNA recombinase